MPSSGKLKIRWSIVLGFCSLLIVFNLVSTSKYLKSWAVVVVSVVVSVLACYSDDPSSNPAEVLRFSVPYLTLVENNQIQAIILWEHYLKVSADRSEKFDNKDEK